MRGRLREAIELCETALEAARLSASPHELYRALFELGWTLYYAGDLDGAIAAHEESSRVDPRLAGGTIPERWRRARAGDSASRGSSRARSNAADELLLELVGENVASTMPVERCFDWESLTLVELAVGDMEAADGYAGRAEEDAAQLPLQLPAALAGTVRERPCCSPPASRSRRLASAHESAEAAGSRRSATPGSVLPQPGGTCARGREASALEAIAVLREAEQELDACGSVRVRDEMRRELRKLGARAEPRGPATAGDSGIDALTQARARDRGARHRSADKPRDRGGAVSQRQDGRVARAQHLPQARCLVAGRDRAGDRA